MDRNILRSAIAGKSDQPNDRHRLFCKCNLLRFAKRCSACIYAEFPMYLFHQTSIVALAYPVISY